MKIKHFIYTTTLLCLGCLLMLPAKAAPLQAQDLLPNEEAFHLSVEAKKNEVVTLNWQIQPGYELYREQIRILSLKDRQPLVSYSELPRGKTKHDDVLGSYQIYEQMLIIHLAWRQNLLDQGILVHYQGCASNGFCYPPIMKAIHIQPDGKVDINTFDGTLYQNNHTQTKTPANSNIDVLFTGSLPWLLASFLGLGILLTFTPCVLPMIPIVFSMIIGNKPTRVPRAILLTSAYVLSMASTYALAGVTAAWLGYSVQAKFQTAFFIIPMVLLLSVMALMQFGIIEMNMLSKLNQRLNHLGQQRQGSLLGALLLGFISALIISPCVTPAFVGALTYISEQGDPWIGGLALFALGLGMGVALFAVAILGATVLPKTGPWMNTIRNTTGVLLVALIIWLLERILSPSITLFLWGLLILLVGVYIGAFDTKREKTDWMNFWRGIGVLLALFGSLLIVSSFSRSNHLASPFIQWLGNQAKPLASQKDFITVSTEKDLQTALKAAQQNNDYSLIYFTASWCTYCKKINTLLTLPDIESKLMGLQKIRVDVSDYSLEHRSMMQQWRVFAPPVFIFLTPDGKEIQDYRLIGELNDAQLTKHLEFFIDQYPEAKP